MVVLKAKYRDGNIVWEEPPPFKGGGDVIVIYSPTEMEAPSTNRTVKRDCINQIQAHFNDVPEGVSLVDELIAERRREAARE